MQERRLDFERLDGRNLCATIGLGAESETSADDRRIVPVTIDDSTGVRAAEVRLKYDATAWSVEPSAIKTGDAWVRGGAALAKIDSEAGEITVFVFATEKLSGDQGNLINLEFSPQSPAADESPQVELKSVRLNEGEIAAEIEVSDDPAEMDYINPRVRASTAAPITPAASITTTALLTITERTTKESITPALANRAGEFPRLSRDRNGPMGPLPLALTEGGSATSTATDAASVASIRPAILRPTNSWLTMLAAADDDQRFRKRAV